MANPRPDPAVASYRKLLGTIIYGLTPITWLLSSLGDGDIYQPFLSGAYSTRVQEGAQGETEKVT